MKQNNTIISIVKTKIGNFLIEFYKKSIIKFLPTNKQVSYNSPDIKKIENNLNKYFLGKKKKYLIIKLPLLVLNFKKKYGVKS